MKKFQEPEILVNLFAVEDIITTSTGSSGNSSEGSGTGGGEGL